MSSIPASSSTVDGHRNTKSTTRADRFLHAIVTPVGSLKLTVTSFALAITLILIGTLAQVGKDIWEVLGLYFYTWFTWVDVSVFFPRSWFPNSWFPWLDPSRAAKPFALLTVLTTWVVVLLLFANHRERAARLFASTLIILGMTVAVSALLTGGFWFPGGATIGSVMCLNLVAAHMTRYKIIAKGRQRLIGYCVAVLGMVVTWLIIATGHNSNGFQGEPSFAWTTLWSWVKVGLSLIGLGLFGYSIMKPSKRRFVAPILGSTGVLLLCLSVWLWVTGDATYLGDSGMRVLWQLILATSAGIVLLAASVLLFGQRAGVIVLHLGIGLMMFGQWFVSQYDVEEQMTMKEGQVVNYGQDIRSVELAVIRRNAPDFAGKDDVVVIPMTKNGRPTKWRDQQSAIDTDLLPFNIEVVDYQKSSSVEMANSETQSPVNSGSNQDFQIVTARPASGATGDSVDLASGYFRVIDKTSGDPLGTYLLSQQSLMMRGGAIRNFNTETVEVGDTAYDLQLRFVRNYKDYNVELIDVSKDDYLGTDIPRNYSSKIHLTDAEREIDRELTIWMNNPRRYAGETFYQSGWQQDRLGNEYSTLQVVRNQGWMIPYVACMICFVGLSYHFALLLFRFLDRQTRTGENDSKITTGKKGRSSRWSAKQLILPGTVAAVFALYLGSVAQSPSVEKEELDLYAFGDLPLVYQGRVKPFDTLARNSLRVISEGETFKGVMPSDELRKKWPKFAEEVEAEFPGVTAKDIEAFKDGNTKGLIESIVDRTQSEPSQVTQFVEDRLFTRQPAIRWLLDVISGSENARHHKVVRIYHPEILDLLGLKKRKYYRYSLEEIAPKMDELEAQVRQADRLRQEDAEKISLYQNKVFELDRRLRQVLLLHRAFSPPAFPPLPTAEEFQNDQSAAMQKINAFRQAVLQQEEAFRALKPPLAVPPMADTEEDEWQAYAAAWPRQLLAVQLLGQEAKPSFRALNEMLLAYLDQDAANFNAAVSRYQQQLTSAPPKELISKPTAFGGFVNSRFGSFYAFESYFNHFAPFFNCSIFYLLSFVILCIGWLKQRERMNRIAFWLIVFTFTVHTIALVSRIYISGRPPVTNLYSSAVFIGWGIVLLSIIIECFYRSGLASLAAAGCGFATLLIAQKLAGDGDTFEVLQAVLDTQFWLATHVVCITFGYATTFLAGGLGLVYVLRGILTKSLTAEVGHELARMIYGTLCFAIFFSFIGTVLGGLWADDSWGRFWGWDPKENGALIIVLWNALILHARWDRIIRDRGLAVLALVGNIVTAWSWFGVNELGVGLHSYGFTEGRLQALAFTILAHLGIVLLGCLPLSLWWSYRNRVKPPDAS